AHARHTRELTKPARSGPSIQPPVQYEPIRDGYTPYAPAAEVDLHEGGDPTRVTNDHRHQGFVPRHDEIEDGARGRGFLVERRYERGTGCAREGEGVVIPMSASGAGESGAPAVARPPGAVTEPEAPGDVVAEVGERAGAVDVEHFAPRETSLVRSGAPG